MNRNWVRFLFAVLVATQAQARARADASAEATLGALTAQIVAYQSLAHREPASHTRESSSSSPSHSRSSSSSSSSTSSSWSPLLSRAPAAGLDEDLAFGETKRSKTSPAGNVPDLDVHIYLQTETEFLLVPMDRRFTATMPAAQRVLRVHRQMCPGSMLPATASRFAEQTAVHLTAPSLTAALAYLSVLYDGSLKPLSGLEFDRAGVIALCHRYQAPNCDSALQVMFALEALSKASADAVADMILVLTRAQASGDEWAKRHREQLILNVRAVQLPMAQGMLRPRFTESAVRDALSRRATRVPQLTETVSGILAELDELSKKAKNEVVVPLLCSEVGKLRSEVLAEEKRQADHLHETERPLREREAKAQAQRAAERDRLVQTIVGMGARALVVDRPGAPARRKVVVEVDGIPWSEAPEFQEALSRAARNAGFEASVDPDLISRVRGERRIAQKQVPECYYCPEAERMSGRHCVAGCCASICSPCICLLGTLTGGCFGLSKGRTCWDRVCTAENLGAQTDLCCYRCLHGGTIDVTFELLPTST